MRLYVVALLLALLTFLLLLSRQARAHDARHPELDRWYGSLSRPGMPSCCSLRDCHRTEAELRDGRWWARLGHPASDEGGAEDWALDDWVPIPDEIIVRDERGRPVSNPAGEAVICHEVSWVGNPGRFTTQIDPMHVVLFCFVPGSES